MYRTPAVNRATGCTGPHHTLDPHVSVSLYCSSACARHSPTPWLPLDTSHSSITTKHRSSLRCTRFSKRIYNPRVAQGTLFWRREVADVARPAILRDLHLVPAAALGHALEARLTSRRRHQLKALGRRRRPGLVRRERLRRYDPRVRRAPPLPSLAPPQCASHSTRPPLLASQSCRGGAICHSP